jgi:Bacterial TSP3 repeat
VGDRLRSIGRRIADLGTGFVDAFLRDNKVLPPVLAVLALFVVAWILAGVFMGDTDQKPVAHRADLAKSNGAPAPKPADPGVENRDVDSYAAYRSKDPFREILSPETTSVEGTTERTTPKDKTNRKTRRNGSSPGAGATDTDGDGLPDRRERNLGTNPNNADTDGDGLPDGKDDFDGDGRPDGRSGGSGGTGGRGGGLLNSGGILPVP